MLARLAGMVVRALLEVAVATIVVGLILAVVAFRIGRRVVIDKPGRLDRFVMSSPPLLVMILQIVGRLERMQASSRVESPPTPYAQEAPDE